MLLLAWCKAEIMEWSNTEELLSRFGCMVVADWGCSAEIRPPLPKPDYWPVCCWQRLKLLCFPGTMTLKL